MKGWIGVDLDGTLAMYDGWVGVSHIGEPVPAMLQRVRRREMGFGSGPVGGDEVAFDEATFPRDFFR